MRFLLIILVSIGHFVNGRSSETYQGVYLFVYSFHMPLFMFISGLFHKNKNIIRRVLAYICIYAIFCLSIYGIKTLFGVKTSLKLLEQSGAPWFMLALAVYIVLGYLLRSCNLFVVLAVSVAVSLAAGYFSEIGYFLCGSRIIYFWPYYCIGMLARREKLEEAVSNRKFRIAGAAVLICWLAVCMLLTAKVSALRPFMTGKLGYPEERYALGALFRFGMYLLASGLSLAFIFITPRKNLGVITEFGGRTIQVYFWHRLILYVLAYNGIADFFYNGGAVMKMLWIAVAVVVSLFTSLKIFEFPVTTIVNLAKSRKK